MGLVEMLAGRYLYKILIKVVEIEFMLCYWKIFINFAK